MAGTGPGTLDVVPSHWRSGKLALAGEKQHDFTFEKEGFQLQLAFFRAAQEYVHIRHGGGHLSRVWPLGKDISNCANWKARRSSTQKCQKGEALLVWRRVSWCPTLSETMHL